MPRQPRMGRGGELLSVAAIVAAGCLATLALLGLGGGAR